MKRTANNSCRPLVQNRTPFQGSNLFAEQRAAHGAAHSAAVERYIVYSYGRHWPLFIFVPKSALPDGTPCTSTLAGGAADGLRFENKDKYSRTTTKHRDQAHPRCATVPISWPAMRELAESGRIAHAVVMHAEA